jgi:hypothetical protein
VKNKKTVEGKKHYGHAMQHSAKAQNVNNCSNALIEAFDERRVNKDLPVLRPSQRYC